MGWMWEYIKKPMTVGAVVPSSRFLVAKMVKPIDFSKAKNIVELGAGTGVVTKEILRQMRKDAKLTVFEIHPPFVEQLQQLNDRRMDILSTPAEQLATHVQGADAIISSLPLIAFPKKTVLKILGAVKKSLKPTGTFVQFQYAPKSRRLLKEHFSEVSLDFTPLNIPPAFVYRCRP